MVNVHIVKCKRCKKNVSTSDLAMKPDGRIGNVCNHCADVLRSLQEIDVKEIIRQRINDNRPKYIRCEKCGKPKMWPLEFGPKYICKVCERRNTKITSAVLKRRKLARKWKEENKDKVREANERYKEKKRKWREEHPVEAKKKYVEGMKEHRKRVRFAKAIRRARLADLSGTVRVVEQVKIAPPVWEGKETGKETEERISGNGIGMGQEGLENRTNVL